MQGEGNLKRIGMRGLMSHSINPLYAYFVRFFLRKKSGVRCGLSDKVSSAVGLR